MRLQEYIDNLARDCIHFSDNHPCREHLNCGATCKCDAYQARTSKALFIQLSSPETVIRSNALMQRMKKDHPGLHITYMTNWPDLLGERVNETVRPDGAGFARIQSETYDQAWNLDPQREACAVMNMIQAEKRGGIELHKSHPRPLESAAGFFVDHLVPVREKSSQRIIKLRKHIQNLFTICQLEYQREMPYLSGPSRATYSQLDIPNPIALFHINDRWPFTTRHWNSLLSHMEGDVVITGDETSDLVCRHIARKTKAVYPGPISMKSWLNYASAVDMVFCPAGWQAESAWALGKQVIAVQMTPEDPLYQHGDFSTRMNQIAHDQLSPGRLTEITLEILLTYTFNPDEIQSRMVYPTQLIQPQQT